MREVVKLLRRWSTTDVLEISKRPSSLVEAVVVVYIWSTNASPSSSRSSDFFCFVPTMSTAFFRPRLPRFFFSIAGGILIVGCMFSSIALVTLVTMMGGMASVGESTAAVMMRREESRVQRREE